MSTDSWKITHVNLNQSQMYNTYVPSAGELIINEYGDVKIGDGKSTINQLTYFLVHDLIQPDIDNEVKKFIETNIDLIDDYNFDELYDRVPENIIREVTNVLLDAGINPKDYLATVPVAIVDMV